MTNKTLKIAGLSLLALIGLYALKQYNDKKKVVNKSSSTTTPGTPKNFSVKTGSDTSTKYWKDEKGTFFMQEVGPLVKTGPVSISSADYLSAYSKFVA